MILVDTSIIVGYFRGAVGVAYDAFNELLNSDVALGIEDHIYQEVLQGARTSREFETLKEFLLTLRRYELRFGRQSYENAARRYALCRKIGVTIRTTVDVLIAETAIENHLYLLHHDRDFINMARVIKELELYLPASTAED
jgi:predicted nucleic acid-binding protein